MLSISRSTKILKRASNPNPDSRSAQTVENNDDLLNKILVYLPIKHLLRFKCVSKRWLSVITHPEFSLQVSSKSNSISGLFLHNTFSVQQNFNYDFIPLDNSKESSTAPPFRSLYIDDHPTPMTVLQSCNGLLLCHCSCSFRYGRNYYVYNPTTKQRTLLPPLKGDSSKIFDVCLAFDPSKSPHYKAFCIRSSEHSLDHYQMEVYSSNTGPWRLSGPPFLCPSRVEFANRVFCNNAVHWFGCAGYCLSYDIETENFSVNAVPRLEEEEEEEEEEVVRHTSPKYFGESQGHLHVVNQSPTNFEHLLVYELERDGSGWHPWHPKYQMDMESLAGSFPEMKTRDAYEDMVYYRYRVLCVVREEKDEDSYVVLHIPNKVIRVNFKDNTSKKLQDIAQTLDDALEFDTLDFPLQFIESLACV